MSAYPRAVAAGWFPIATSHEVKKKPVSRTLMDKPLVLFRSTAGIAVLLDSCPHRNVALSGGQVKNGEIECPYHGWRFAQDGRCTLTPGADNPALYAAKSYPVIDRAGLVWTTLATIPQSFPMLPTPIMDQALDAFWWPIGPSPAHLIDAVENLLDPAHPHFLHTGIVRSKNARRSVDVTVSTRADRAQATYLENAHASALMPRLLEGVRTVGIGRFLAPSTAQLIYEGSAGIRLVITVFFVPETAERVRAFAHFATPKGRLPAFLKALLLRGFSAPVLMQDRVILRQQAKNIARLGTPNFAIGPLDFLRPAIETLMNGECPNESELQATVNL